MSCRWLPQLSPLFFSLCLLLLLFHFGASSPVTERNLIQLTRHLQGSQLLQAGALGKTKGGGVGFIINESLCNHVAVMRRT